MIGRLVVFIIIILIVWNSGYVDEVKPYVTPYLDPVLSMAEPVTKPIADLGKSAVDAVTTQFRGETGLTGAVGERGATGPAGPAGVFDSNQSISTLKATGNISSDHMLAGAYCDGLDANCTNAMDIRKAVDKTSIINDDKTVIQTPGRFHISSGEQLYILPKDGIKVTKNWGASGDLYVQGITRSEDGMSLSPTAKFEIDADNVPGGRFNVDQAGNANVKGQLRSNSVGRANANDKDWFRIFGPNNIGTAVYNGMSVSYDPDHNPEANPAVSGGLAVGDWSQQPHGNIKATGTISGLNVNATGNIYTPNKVKSGAYCDTDGGNCSSAAEIKAAITKINNFNDKSACVGRWCMRDENNVLVFRDMQTAPGIDGRYAMFPNTYVDLNQGAIYNNDKVTLRSGKANVEQRRLQRGADDIGRFVNNNQGDWEQFYLEKL